jgi:hypothetical protein
VSSSTCTIELYLIQTIIMPVTITVAKHGAQEFRANNIKYNAKPSRTPEQLLEASIRQDDYKKFHAMIQSSFSDISSKAIYPADNGFVRAAITAYNQHHHLILRPEDIWFSILTQFSLYVNANSEILRSTFVSHEGKKELVLVTVGTIHTFDWSVFATQMTKLLSQNINDPDLRAWILPSFSTTTPTDTVTASIIMMGTLQKYFEYCCMMMCGIPTVTLLGTKEDWQNILSRLPKLATFGSEPALFGKLLTPVLEHFIASFDNPTSEETVSFWSRICHENHGGSGDPQLSGWLTAFMFWTEKGKSLCERWTKNNYYSRASGCDLNGVQYHRVGMSEIPSGSCSVPVIVDDNGTMYDTLMVAGSVGVEVSASGGEVAPPPAHPWDRQGEKMRGDGMDTMQPVSGWWMFDTGKKGDKGGNFDGVMELKEGSVIAHIGDPRLDLDPRSG